MTWCKKVSDLGAECDKIIVAQADGTRQAFGWKKDEKAGRVIFTLTNGRVIMCKPDAMIEVCADCG